MLADQPLPWLVQDADEHEDLVDVPVRAEQVHPREHPHEVVDPERGNDEQQQQHAVPAGVPGQVVGHGVPDEQAQNGGDRDVDERAQKDDAKLPGEDLAEDRPELRRVPVQRVPGGQRAAEDGVRRSHGHREDRVERDQEEQDQPDYARDRQRGPQPALLADRAPFVRTAHAANLLAGPSPRPRANVFPPRASTAW